MASSDEDERKKDAISEMFGEDSDDSDNDQVRSSSTATVTADTSGLFGSDSESDEDEAPAKALKKKRSSSPPSGKRSKGSEPRKRKHEGGDRKHRKDDEGNARKRRAGGDSGDEYDSGEEISRSKDDDDFIDKEDDLADVLGEYDEDQQNFDDERPVETAERTEQREDFFDQTLKSLKTGRRSKLNMSVQEMEQVVQELLYQMDKAWADDQASLADGKPALERIKYVDKALRVMRKHQLQPMLLDFDLLSIVKKWISPLDDGTLPNLGMRSKMLQMITRLPIYKDHLKRSGFGKVVMALWKHPEETMENKEICRDLIERWSRSVFNKTLDYSKLSELEAEKAENAPYRRPDKNKAAANGNRTESGSNLFRPKQESIESMKADTSERARLPQQLRFDFLHRPQPKIDVRNIPSKKVDPESRRGRLSKRMQDIAKPGKKGKRAISLSIEGR